MIHDKDYIIRQVRQFSNFLSKLILDKNEIENMEDEAVFETQMKDLFKMSFEELSAMNIDEISDWVDAKDEPHHIAYYELLGHLFYYKYKENPDRDFADKARAFYEIWLQKSQIFSMPVMSRISELK